MPLQGGIFCLAPLFLGRCHQAMLSQSFGLEDTATNDDYCIVLEVPPQKDTGSLQRPVAHTGSYTMEATLLFSPFNPCSARTRVERREKMSFLGAR